MKHVAVVLGVLAWLVAGTWFWGAVVAPGFLWTIGLVVAWFLVTGVVTTRLSRRRPDLRLSLRGTYLATAAVALAAGWWTSVRETTVDEPLETGVPASRLAPMPGGVDPLAPQP